MQFINGAAVFIALLGSVLAQYEHGYGGHGAGYYVSKTKTPSENFN